LKGTGITPAKFTRKNGATATWADIERVAQDDFGWKVFTNNNFDGSPIISRLANADPDTAVLYAAPLTGDGSMLLIVDDQLRPRAVTRGRVRTVSSQTGMYLSEAITVPLLYQAAANGGADAQQLVAAAVNEALLAMNDAKLVGAVAAGAGADAAAMGVTKEIAQIVTLALLIVNSDQ
jgi:hypothetical protein